MNYFELKADYEKVAAFSYSCEAERAKAKKKVFDLLEATKLDLYRDKVMQVIDVNDTQEKIIHEEHPTVLDIKPLTSLAYDLYVL
tara:strand:+ start:2150 stop:2404 length:255 start_codon:yes stop_codon:yes gene_type:complete